MQDIDRLLTDLAEQQHGLIAWRQARPLGLSAKARRHRLARGDWVHVSDRVARRAGAPPSGSQRALAAVLDAGPSAAIACRAAAAFWAVPGFRLDPLEVIAVRTRSDSSRLAIVHHPRHLPDPFATVLDGIPVVRPALLLLQLASTVHPARLRRVLDHLWSRRLLSAPSVRSELAPLMHRGRPGTAALRELLDSLPEDYTPTASGLEARFAHILAEAGLPPMRRQVDLGDDERWCGRVDFVGVDLPLVVEVDSDRYHRALGDVADDAVRQERMHRAGFVVERVSEHDIWHRPQVVVAAIRARRAELQRHQAA